MAARNAERVRFKPGAKQVENLPGLIVTKLRSGEGPSAVKAMHDQQKKAVVTRPKAILSEVPLPDAPPDAKTLRFLTRGMTFPAPLYTRLKTLFLSGSVKAHDVTSLRGADTEQIEKQVAAWELHK